MLFLAVPGPGGVWRIIRGPASGPVASTAVSPATAPGLTGRPRALPQKSARAAGSAESMVRAAKLRLTVVVMMVSFRWVDSQMAVHGGWHQRFWRTSEDGALTCPGDRFWWFPLVSRSASAEGSLAGNPSEGPVASC